MATITETVTATTTTTTLAAPLRVSAARQAKQPADSSRVTPADNDYEPTRAEFLRMTFIVVAHYCFAAMWLARGLSFEEMTLPMFIAAMVAGTLYVDFMSTMTHFTLDNYGKVTTPIVGLPIFYFREHHDRPLRMLVRCGVMFVYLFFEREKNTCTYRVVSVKKKKKSRTL